MGQIIPHQLAQMIMIAVDDEVFSLAEPLAHAGPVVDHLEHARACCLEQPHIAAVAHEIPMRINRDFGRAGYAQHLLAQRAPARKRTQ